MNPWKALNRVRKKCGFLYTRECDSISKSLQNIDNLQKDLSIEIIQCEKLLREKQDLEKRNTELMIENKELKEDLKDYNEIPEPCKKCKFNEGYHCLRIDDKVCKSTYIQCLELNDYETKSK